ncbi:class I SAM-dependent methyltransferase [Candidatus Woesearchaeota archaeon]|nr:MAG: type 11 methyltransferase [archaeon GW2011_AR18]MBS3162150.1 class I SAM-dependent methyltransferase [Candidatus Woesearchaeota archaeon]HIH26256.1 class I SAM-dependent methyltransferase [Nanoarchaeota archaeon]
MGDVNFNTEKYHDEGSININNDFKSRMDAVVDMCGSGKKILDIGCFTGYLMDRLKKNNNDVFGVDISKNAVALAKKKGLRCYHGDIDNGLRFNDKSFDIIVMGEIIEHIFDTDKVIKEISRMLKDNGEVIITTPNIACLNRRIRLFLGKNPYIDIGVLNDDNKTTASGHIRYFTFHNLKILLERNGFKVNESTSDVILLKSLRSYRLSKLFPSLGWSIIMKARKV